MDLVNSIKNHFLFHSADHDTLNKIAADCRIRKLLKERELFAAGDQAKAFFIILKGWVKLYRISKNGEETIVHIFGPGESFAEGAMFNNHKTYPVNAQAIQDTELVEVPSHLFIKVIKENPDLVLRMLDVVACRNRYLVHQLEQIASRTAPQRIGTFLLKFCQQKEVGFSHSNHSFTIIELPYDKSTIATHLNIQPETFSRGLQKLKPYGVEIKERKIIITDKDKLTKFCEFSDTHS